MGNKVYQVNAGGNTYDIDDRQADIDAAQLRQDLIAERERAELAEQQLQQEKQSVVKVVWNEYAHIDQFITPGIYDITGERLTTNDGLPIANASPGHTIAARLTVLSSSIKGDGAEDDKCITQMLVLSNRTGGDGDVYIRTGRASMANLLAGGVGWEPWGKLQQNIEVGQVDSLDELKDNGVYSGVWSKGHYNSYPLTFVCVVINDYFIGIAPRRISQFVYGLSKFDGSVVYWSRVWNESKDKWGDWDILNKNEIASLISAEVEKLTNVDAGIIERIQTLALWVEEHGVEAAQLAAGIQQNATAIATEQARAEQAEKANADAIVAEKERAISHLADEIEKIKDGGTIVGQAREIHSRNGKNVTDSFLVRTTAGSGTIGDGVATLKSVGGNIVKNLISMSSLANWNPTNGSYSSGVVNTVVKKADGRFGMYLNNIPFIEGHKYYLHFDAKTDIEGLLKFYISNFNNNITSSNTWATYSYIHVIRSNYDTGKYVVLGSEDGSISRIDLSNILLIDLTEMFGTGNEPDIATCDRLFGTMDALPQGLSFANPTTFTSTGFNQFNPDNVLEGKTVVDNAIVSGDKKIAVIPCLPCKVGVGENNGYCIHGNFGSDIKVYLTPLNPMEIDGELYIHELAKNTTTDTYVPLIKGYMLVEVPTTANLCAHFLWSEDKCERDAYEPYFEKKIELPAIPQMSEWGLAGIQSSGTLVCDEIDLERGVYVKRIKRVYIDTFRIYPKDNNVYELEFIESDNINKRSVFCPAYATDKADGVSATKPDKCIYPSNINVHNRFYIVDSSIADAASLKEAMKNVPIYVELATPEEYPLHKVDNNYISSDYGVEQFDSVVPCNANNLYYMRSLAGETRNFLDRLMAGLGTSDATVVADRILAVINPTGDPTNIEPETSIEE